MPNKSSATPLRLVCLAPTGRAASIGGARPILAAQPAFLDHLRPVLGTRALPRLVGMLNQDLIRLPAQASCSAFGRTGYCSGGDHGTRPSRRHDAAEVRSGGHAVVWAGGPSVG